MHSKQKAKTKIWYYIISYNIVDETFLKMPD